MQRNELIFALIGSGQDVFIWVARKGPATSLWWHRNIHYFNIEIYIYAFNRRFYPKRLTVHSGYNFFCQYVRRKKCSLFDYTGLFQSLTELTESH